MFIVDSRLRRDVRVISIAGDIAGDFVLLINAKACRDSSVLRARGSFDVHAGMNCREARMRGFVLPPPPAASAPRIQRGIHNNDRKYGANVGRSWKL